MNLFQLVIGVLAIVGMFLLLIGPHEFGHFALAKLFGVGVYEYSLGMGNRIWSATRGGTLYALRAIPLGGYVRLAGMEPGDYEAPSGFHSTPAYRRLLILCGGPLANFILSALLMTVVYWTVAHPAGFVSAITPNSPAAAAGLRSGDVIEEVNGRTVLRQEDIRQIEDANPGAPLSLRVRRPNGDHVALTLTPVYEKRLKVYLIGVQGRGTFTTPFGQPVRTQREAIQYGAVFPFQAAAVISVDIYHLIIGKIPGGLLGPGGATGPIGIGAITYDAASQGILPYVYVLAMLSAALGVTNLLPLPALDGGRILVVLLEKSRGKPFDRDRENLVQRYGLIVLLALTALIAIVDVQRILAGQFSIR